MTLIAGYQNFREENEKLKRRIVDLEKTLSETAADRDGWKLAADEAAKTRDLAIARVEEISRMPYVIVGAVEAEKKE